MREILFRGKSIIGGEWVFGTPVCVEENTYPTDRVLLVEAVNYDELDHFLPQYESEEVIPATVGQFTGLYDKHGNKIFEGDIVEYNGSNHEVVFELRNGATYFGIKMNPIETWGFCFQVHVKLMVVIGNIHDTPELLEAHND